MRRLILFCCLLLSCAHPPTPNDSRTQTEKKLPFGDEIDEQAWMALGPRPADAAPLPVAPMRMEEFWFLEPDARVPRNRIAARLVAKADTSRARGEGERLDLYLDAIRIAPLTLRAWGQSVRLLVDESEIQRAHALAVQYVRIAHPGDGYQYYALGKCQARMGQLDEALHSFELALRAPDKPEMDAAAGMALIHLQRGNLAAAESLQAVYDIRDEATLLLLRGMRARADGDLPGAVQAFEELVALPAPPSGAWEKLAAAQLDLGSIDAARDAYEHARREAPQKSAALIGLARVALAGDDPVTAQELLTEVVRREPENLPAQFDLGVALLENARRGRGNDTSLRRAEACWTQCIRARFESEASLWGRAECALRRGDLSAASFDAADLHEITQDIPAAHARWARLLLLTGHDAEALDALREAARHGELDRDGRALLARQEDKAGTDAVDMLRRAFAENPEDASTGMRLGVALLVDGELEEAERVLRAVVALRPEDPNALQNLAAVLDRRKKYREAEQLLRKAESLR